MHTKQRPLPRIMSPPPLRNAGQGRLALTRKTGERIRIADSICIRVVRVNGDRGIVSIAIHLPAATSLRHRGLESYMPEGTPDVTICLFNGEAIVLGDVIRLTVLKLKPDSGKVVFSIEAPPEVAIHREEIAQRMVGGIVSLARELRHPDLEGLPVSEARAS